MLHRTVSKTLVFAVLITALALAAAPAAQATPRTHEPTVTQQGPDQAPLSWLTSLWDLIQSLWTQAPTAPGPDGGDNLLDDGDPGEEGTGPAIDPSPSPAPATG